MNGAEERLPERIVRRWVDLHNRVAYFEETYGPNSPTAEKAVKQLIDFEESAGSALAAALALGPAHAVKTRLNEEDFA